MTTFETVKEEHKKYMERNNMTDCCEREKTLLEELKDLEIEDRIKERLVCKCERLLKNLAENETWLSNCHHYQFLADTRINELEQTIANMCVEQFGKAKWQYEEQNK